MCHVLLHRSLPFLPLLKILIPRRGKWGGGGKRVKIPRDRLTMCRWIKKSYYCVLILINGSHSIPVLPKTGQRWGL